MTAQQWTFMDRAAWGAGPWDGEPDKAQWTDAATGLPCMMHRGGLGAWCGYVGVAPGHPAYGKDFREVDAGVHGGLNYAKPCDPGFDAATGEGVCHVPEPGEPADVWWLGFDCGHAFDLQPVMEAEMRKVLCDFQSFLARADSPVLRIVYRDMNYVRAQCAHLALQLHAQAT